MKVYLINLDSSIDRLNAATAQLNSLGVDFERVSAVNGKNLTPNEKKAAVNKFRWDCAVGREVWDGEIGCALSHRHIREQIIRDNVPVSCVLEDDVVLSKDFPKVLDYLEKSLDPNKSMVVLLSNHEKGCVRGIKNKGIGMLKTQADMFAEGYVQTLAAARQLNNVNFPLVTPCDWWGRWVKRGIIELYHSVPTVCSQNRTDFAGLTGSTDFVPIKERNLIGRVVHILRRLFGKIIDWLLEVV